MKYIITEKQLKLIEGLNLKSRASEQEKQREEYINELLKKPIEEIGDFRMEMLNEEQLKKLMMKLKEYINNNYKLFMEENEDSIYQIYQIDNNNNNIHDILKIRTFPKDFFTIRTKEPSVNTIRWNDGKTLPWFGFKSFFNFIKSILNNYK